MANNIKIGNLQKALKKSDKGSVFKTSKELIEKMVSLGFTEVKSHTDIVSEAAFNILFADLSDTCSTDIDIKDYIDGKAVVVGYSKSSKEEKKITSNVSDKAEIKNENTSVVNSAKKGVSDVSGEKKAADVQTGSQSNNNPAHKNTQQGSNKKPVAQGNNTQQSTAQKAPAQGNNTQQNATKKAATQGNNAQQNTAKKSASQGNDAQQSTAQKIAAQGKNTQQSTVQKPAPQSNNAQRENKKPATQQKITTGIKAQQTQRSFTAPDFSKSTKQDNKKAQQATQKGKQQPQNPVAQKPKGGIEISSGESVTRNTNPKARVVDTRGGSVDLSKYDERFEKLASERNYSDARGGKVFDGRTKKSGKFDKEKDKERLELERTRRQQMEKARKLPVSVSIPDEITVGELASRLKITGAELIKKLFMLGVMANVNQTIDFDTAYLVADEMGAKVTKEVVVTIEDKLFEEEADPENKLVKRAPVVCVMGHVDHGKTSLLDAIRHTHVTSGEAGGITQHIGAYRVKVNDQDITFLDTPGHEAFTAMRARGAQATDIAILVVAADDGIMPQTVEAINHAKAAGVEIIVAINKMDKPSADPENIKQELTQYELVPEEWGGDVICVPVSALTGKGIDDLLENVLLVAELKEYKANPDRHAKGIVIEAKLDRGRGPVATVLVQNGTLKAGDFVIAGTAVGRVRDMISDKGKSIKKAEPSVPVEIVGLDEVPQPGDEFNAVENERMARELAEQRKAKQRDDILKQNRRNLENFFDAFNESELKTLNIIVKADVQGSAEAVKAKLTALTNDEVKVNVIHAAVGGVSEGDVSLAAASDAVIIGFNVRPDRIALELANRQNIEIRTYSIIYECVDEITAAMKGMLAPKYRESVIGHADVRQAIRVPNVGIIAGCYITNGKVTRGCQMRILRDSVVLCQDKVNSLRRFKDDVREVAEGYECGIGIEKFNDIREGDQLEFFEMVEIER